VTDLAAVERELRARHAELHAKLTGLAEPQTFCQAEKDPARP